ncbi:hypothetical protein [Sphingomonas changnyeongensis]|nr:hypothetical protein [Sphingomonas changnyeongensis]
MELNTCEIAPSRRQNLTRMQSVTMALLLRIKDALRIAGPD